MTTETSTETVLRTKLPELQAANLPVCRWTDVFKLGEGETMDPQDAAALDDYLKAFLPPGSGGECVCCGVVQGGLMAALLGGFTWGLVNGEGNCGRCGYPGRALHRDVGPIEFFSLILQYHPSGLSLDKSAAEVA